MHIESLVPSRWGGGEGGGGSGWLQNSECRGGPVSGTCGIKELQRKLSRVQKARKEAVQRAKSLENLRKLLVARGVGMGEIDRASVWWIGGARSE